MGFTKLGTPVTSSDWDNGKLGEDDGASDGGCDLLCTLDTESDVTVEVTDCDEGLETGALTGTGLLLDGHDLHDLIFEFGKEEVDDLVLLDWEREEVDLLHRFDFAVFYETAELGDGLPLLLLVFAASTTGTPAPTATITATTTKTTASASSSVSHFYFMGVLV